ncbi:hypothetical protein MYXO_01852 [Myxococcaceae bacterium]|nr:hypothetical protein MYXO_01852 [Myxococcaceae bacterium]
MTGAFARRWQWTAALGALVLLDTACATCRTGSAVVVNPSAGGSIGPSGASTWASPGVGLDLSSLLCRAPDPATLPQPGPGSPPIPDASGQAPAVPARELPAGAVAL